MIKSAIAGTAVLALAAGFIFGIDIFSYGRTLCTNAREAVRSGISPEFELDTIRSEIDRLMPDIVRHKKIVAEQIVDVRGLEGAIAEKEASLQSQKSAVLALRSFLDSDRATYVYRYVSYSREEVETDLADRFEAFRTLEDSVARDNRILSAQNQTLRANRQKLDSMLDRKQELAVDVAQLQARLKQIQATEAVHAVEVDDSLLNRVEEMIRNLNHSLDVREAMLETEGHVQGRIPVEEPDFRTNDLITEIDQHFGFDSGRTAVAEFTGNGS